MDKHASNFQSARDCSSECSRPLTDSEKYQLLTTAQETTLLEKELDMQTFRVSGEAKVKRISFQTNWLHDHTWLHYGKARDDQGGWCLPCILFLTASEKLSIGAFVNTI